MHEVIAIVAMDESRVIGYNNTLPWDLPEDLKHFSKLTTGHTVLMGKNTYFSLPQQYRPLPKRLNVVFSTSMTKDDEIEDKVIIENSVENFFSKVKSQDLKIKGDKLWVIGGQKLYSSTIHLWDKIELTLVKGKHKGDTYFPEFEDNFSLASSNETTNCKFLTYIRK